MEPVILGAIVAAVAGLASLIKPLFEAKWSAKIDLARKGVKISVTKNDGSVDSVNIAGSRSGTVSGEDIKRIIVLLEEAENGKQADSSKE
jgi:hypothetical protein